MATLDSVSRARSKELDKLLRPYEKSAQYVAQRFGSLVSDYANEWIAVEGSRVVAHARTRSGLKRRLKRERGISPAVYITFLARDEQTLIL
jgi:hypothetical protein